ncbi:ImmA/IrrE family metallo-endopeptidase [Actinosynnema sp. CA-248983]
MVRVARRLSIPDPFDLDMLIREVADVIGKPVDLAPYPEETVEQARRAGEALPAAVCVAFAHRVYVFYRADTTGDHQRHSVLHEVGHLLCGHVTVDGDQPVWAHRSTYDDARERAAEAFAYEFERRLGPVRVRRGPQPTNEDLSCAVDRYGSILEG